MQRICKQYEAEAIQAAFDRLPDAIASRLINTHFLCADPLFAGLHSFASSTQGVSYGELAHCCYPWHIERPASERITTIVLPQPWYCRPSVIIHELGHALHFQFDLEPVASPVSSYARTNRREAFAEAFASWILPGYAKHPDDRTVALLDGIM